LTNANGVSKLHLLKRHGVKQMTKEYMIYAEEIRNQINQQSPMALMSYGATNFIASPENNEQRAALHFKVRGYKHKGHIKIALAWNDTYTIKAMKVRKGEAKVCDSYDNVYCDQLIEILDTMIEGKHYAQ
jgi:hypothetical protein